MNNYIEKEIKVLNVNIEQTKKRLEEMGAQMVFNNKRMISTFDYYDNRCLKNDLLIRLTVENKNVKITTHLNNSKDNRKIIKIHPFEDETICKDFLNALGLEEQTKLESYRVSYELGRIDFDIDQFPGIPPFMEIDIEFLDIPLKELLKKLNLEENQVVFCGTESIFALYGLNYYSLFKI